MTAIQCYGDSNTFGTRPLSARMRAMLDEDRPVRRRIKEWKGARI